MCEYFEKNWLPGRPIKIDGKECPGYFRYNSTLSEHDAGRQKADTVVFDTQEGLKAAMVQIPGLLELCSFGLPKAKGRMEELLKLEFDPKDKLDEFPIPAVTAHIKELLRFPLIKRGIVELVPVRRSAGGVVKAARLLQLLLHIQRPPGLSGEQGGRYHACGVLRHQYSLGDADHRFAKLGVRRSRRNCGGAAVRSLPSGGGTGGRRANSLQGDVALRVQVRGRGKQHHGAAPPLLPGRRYRAARPRV